jgi:hypothetical protein
MNTILKHVSINNNNKLLDLIAASLSSSYRFLESRREEVKDTIAESD